MSESGSPDLPVFCIHLRAKSMFQSDSVDPYGDEYEVGAPCWCQRTMESIGPDDGYVSPDTCQPGRACYEGLN